MTLAVTTASGQLGRSILGALKAMDTGQTLVGLARTPSKAADLGIDIRPGDYDNTEQMTRSLAGVDSLLMVSGMSPPDERTGQHRNVIAAAKAAGVRKLVFTSIQGKPDTGFGPILASSLQTEEDVKASGIDWAIGRNGIYIEPDIEYIDTYRAEGEIANCAGDGKCGYTTRAELGRAYAHLLSNDALTGGTYNLNGTPMTQAELAQHLNKAFGTSLTFRHVEFDAFLKNRTDALGPFFGQVIAGIYQGIAQGAVDNPSDFEAVTGTPHQSWDDYFASLKA